MVISLPKNTVFTPYIPKYEWFWPIQKVWHHNEVALQMACAFFPYCVTRKLRFVQGRHFV
jgi:hypothetical protein